MLDYFEYEAFTALRRKPSIQMLNRIWHGWNSKVVTLPDGTAIMVKSSLSALDQYDFALFHQFGVVKVFTAKNHTYLSKSPLCEALDTAILQLTTLQFGEPQSKRGAKFDAAKS